MEPGLHSTTEAMTVGCQLGNSVSVGSGGVGKPEEAPGFGDGPLVDQMPQRRLDGFAERYHDRVVQLCEFGSEQVEVWGEEGCSSEVRFRSGVVLPGL